LGSQAHVAPRAVSDDAMGFDRDSDKPPMNVRRRTTRVNIWMTLLVLAFLAAGAVMIGWSHAHPHAAAQPAEVKASQP
jgi:hypothetical protein